MEAPAKPKDSFPLDQYLSALVKFLNTVHYRDENYSRAQRLATLKNVYADCRKPLCPT